MGLILLQPDMGTGMVYFPVFLIMALIAGARVRHLMFVGLVALLAVVFDSGRAAPAGGG